MPYPIQVPRSVYVLGDGLLFDEIIANMLTSDARLRVIRGFYVEDAAFLTLVCLCQPEVILLNESDLLRCERIRTVLPQISPAADLRVIVIRPDNNFVHIFDWGARQANRRTGATLTLKRITGWNEMLDLVGGRRLAV
jgi:hypothetical protein